MLFLHQRSDSRIPSSEDSPDRRRKEDKHRRSSAQSDGSINDNVHQELSEDELEKQRAKLLRELQMQQEEN